MSNDFVLGIITRVRFPSLAIHRRHDGGRVRIPHLAPLLSRTQGGKAVDANKPHKVLDIVSIGASRVFVSQVRNSEDEMSFEA